MTKCLLSVFLMALTACGPFQLGSGSALTNDKGNSSLGTTNPHSAEALDILNRNCTSCHGESSGAGNVYGLQNINHMVQAGLIFPGSPSTSLIFNEISTGSMPPGGALSAEEQALIYQWILAASPTASTPTPAPTPTPTPTPSPSPSPTPSPTPVASFAYIEKTILIPKCTACHSGTSGSAGYSFDTYARVMNSVNTKNPTASKLYTIIHSGQMPPKSSQRLNSEQENLILQWIQEGAKNN